MRHPINRIEYKVGEMIGECTYLGDAYSKNWQRYANFKCNCGETFVATITKVKSGHTKSCGCRVAKVLVAMNTMHGMSKSREFWIWTGMIDRCTNKNNKRYSRWGGRGIKICDRWRNSFANFYSDMGERPTPDHSLDRYPNNDGDYEPSNCKWSTRKEQALNRSSNFIVEYNGEKAPLKKLTEKYGLNYDRVAQRIKLLGWSVKDAFEKSKCYVNA